MKRKLVKQGAATMMVSLPSKWVRKNSLGKGDEVEVSEDRNNLIIRASLQKEELVKKTINVSGYFPLINRILISSYVAGFNEVELVFKDREEMKKLKKHVVEDLLGFEIVKQKQNSVLIKDITGYERTDIKEIVKRIFFILDGMIEELIEAFEKKQSTEIVLEMDRNVNKFVHFCSRVLNKIGFKDTKNTIQIYGIVELLEEIGDTIKQIAKISTKKNPLSKAQIQALNNFRGSLNIFEELIFDFKKEKVIGLARGYEDIKKSIKMKDSLDSLLFQLNERIIRMNNFLLVMAFGD